MLKFSLMHPSYLLEISFYYFIQYLFKMTSFGKDKIALFIYTYVFHISITALSQMFVNFLWIDLFSVFYKVQWICSSTFLADLLTQTYVNLIHAYLCNIIAIQEVTLAFLGQQFSKLKATAAAYKTISYGQESVIFF